MHKRLGGWLLILTLISTLLPITPSVTAQDDSLPVITPENAMQLQLLERLGRGSIIGPLVEAPLPHTLIIPTTRGFYRWDYAKPDAEPHLIATDEPMFGALPSPDGRYIAARAEDGYLTVWDTATGEVVFSKGLPPPQAIGAGGMEWAANSQALAVGTWDDTVSVFDPHTGDTLAFYASGITIEIQGFVDPASLVAISPDASRLVWGSWDARVELRSIGDPALDVTITRREDDLRVVAVAWSPDSQFVAVGMSNGTVRIYDAGTGVLIDELDGHLAGAHGSPWQPGTASLAYHRQGHPDHQLVLWDASLRQSRMTDFEADRFAWSPDGTRLALFEPRTVQIVEAASGIILHERDQAGASDGTWRWSPNGAYLAQQTQGLIRHWEVSTGSLVGSTQGGGATWLAGGERLAFYAPDSQTLWVVDATDGATTATLKGFSNRAMRLHWGLGGLQVAASPFTTPVTTIVNASGEVIHHLVRDGEMSDYGFIETFSVVWSADGTRFAIISPKGGIKIWTLDDDWPDPPAIVDAPDPNNLAFSADGRWLVVTGWDNSARVYDASTFAPVTVLSGFTDPTNAAAFSPDRRYLAVGVYSEDKAVYVFATDTWAQIARLPNYNYTYAVPNIAFSPDGQALAYPNRAGGISLWNVATQTLIATEAAGLGWGQSLAWSPDGTLIAVGTYDGEIVIWDAARAELVIILKEQIDSRDYSAPIDALAFSPDGTRLAVLGEDHTVHLWGIR